MRKAIEFLRQARRCEQVNHRLERSREAEPSMKAKYEVLNKEAIAQIKKDLDLKDDKDEEFKAKLQQVTNKEIELTMLGPTLKLQMRRYHKLHDTWKRRAVGKEEKVAQQLYAIKGKGQWHLMKHMTSNVQPKPLIALKRKSKGPMGPAQSQHNDGPERNR